MNREQRRALLAAAENHPEQQRCVCGWLLPRETFVEQITAGPPVARVRMVILCPVCGTRADVEVNASAIA